MLYFLLSLLGTLTGTILIRYVVFVTVWIATGRHLWLLPNLMSEEVCVGQRLLIVVCFVVDPSMAVLLFPMAPVHTLLRPVGVNGRIQRHNRSVRQTEHVLHTMGYWFTTSILLMLLLVVVACDSWVPCFMIDRMTSWS